MTRLRKRVERLESHATVEFDWTKALETSLDRAMSRLQPDERSSVQAAMATRRIDYRSELWSRFERLFAEELKAAGFQGVLTAIDLLL
jgi:hypothetical protein